MERFRDDRVKTYSTVQQAKKTLTVTGHNNLAYFQSKLHPEIDPTCRLCLQANETFHHLMTDCEATTSLQMDIMKNQIPLPDMT